MSLRCSRRAGSRSTRTCGAQTDASPDPPDAALLGTATRAQTSFRAIAALGPIKAMRATAERTAFPRPSAEKARRVPSPCGCACGGVLAGWHARRCAHASLAGPADTVQGVAKLTRARPSRRATQRVRPHAQGTQRRGAGSGDLPFGLPRKGAVCKAHVRSKAGALQARATSQTAPLRGNAIPLHSVSRPSLAVVVRA